MVKIIINEKNLLAYMKKNGIKNYRQLCRECGVSYSAFTSAKSRRYTLPIEMYWLLADRLQCHIEELQIPLYK